MTFCIDHHLEFYGYQNNNSGPLSSWVFIPYFMVTRIITQDLYHLESLSHILWLPVNITSPLWVQVSISNFMVTIFMSLQLGSDGHHPHHLVLWLPFNKRIILGQVSMSNFMVTIFISTWLHLPWDPSHLWLPCNISVSSTRSHHLELYGYHFNEYHLHPRSSPQVNWLPKNINDRISNYMVTILKKMTFDRSIFNWLPFNIISPWVKNGSIFNWLPYNIISP